MNLNDYLFYIMYALIYLSMGVIMKVLLDFRVLNLYDAKEQITNNNLAVGVRRGGVQLGLAIAMIGVLSGGTSLDLQQEITQTVGYGLLSVVFMLFSLLVTDKLVLPGIGNNEELKKGNLAVGVVEFGALIMTGIVAYASIAGEDGGLLSSVSYFFAGQVALVVLVMLYEYIFSRHQVVARVKAGNVSAGIYLASKLIAYGLILQSAILGSVTGSIEQAVYSFLAVAIGGMVILYIFELLIDWVIVTASKVSDILERDEQAAAIQLALAKIGMAAILGMAIL